MDAVFLLANEADRSNYLRSIMNSFDCTYICLWLYLPQPNHRLYFLDGHYTEQNNQPASSSGSLARRLFDQYRREQFYLLNGQIPGTAFINNQPYKELNQSELVRLTSVAVQRQFYQEARIKTAVFMGCRSGEIEMGWSNPKQINTENAMMSWFSEYNISQQSPLREFSQTFDPNRPSSSSSSLRSLDSPDSSPFMFNIPTTSHIPEVSLEAHAVQPIPSTSTAIQQVLQSLQPASSRDQSLQSVQSTTNPLQQAMQSLQQVVPPSTTIPLRHQQAMQSLQQLVPSTSTSPHQQAMQAFALSRNIHLPNRESEEAAMTRAILAVLTSSSSSSCSISNLPHPHHWVNPQRAGAFKSYLALQTPMRAKLRRQSMLKRAITYYTSLNIMRREHMMANRPTSTQLHHMISERRRREKINESFDALRKLLPPEAKKDKASVLTRTREYLTLLKSQVEELSKRNQQLEAQLLPAAAREAHAEEATAENVQQLETSNERVDVRITNNGSESTSEEGRVINLQVVLRGECPVADLIIRLLEFLKLDNKVNLMSIEASSTSREESTSLSRVIFRLRIEGDEWDEAAFLEASRRVAADLSQ